MIELTHISKDFGKGPQQVHAVQDVSLSIGKGEIFGIIGFSGAGKSTLVRCINLLERPTSGAVTVDGRVITALSPKELRKASQLSGGQKQRVAIARALANEPNVLLCDEATSALNSQTTKSILHLLKHLNETLGITIVLITHEMAVVKEICHRVAVMEHGRVVEQGKVFSVFADPKEEITKNFIRTTSNLQKIEDLVAKNSPVVRLQPGEVIVRLSYLQKNVSEPLISTVSQKFGISLNIIFADITIVQDAPIGGTVAVISGERQKITAAVEYLIEKNVGVEVIKDARASE